MRAWLGAILVLVAGCEGSQSEFADAAVEVEAFQPSGTASTEAAAPPPVQARAAPPPPDGPQDVQLRPRPIAGSPPQGVAPLLAYSYGFGLEAPTAGIRALVRAHEQACQTAGPLTCQVVGSSSEQRGEGELGARLEFRAVPAYVARFRAGLESQVKGARGEILSSTVETEDLTRSIIDTEARLRAGRLLRSRLEALIASRPGNLEQLLEIERELARVQGELDAAESTLAVMRARVSMSTVTVDYASRGAVVNPGDGRPLAEAGDSFARNLAASSAAILTFVSVVLPWSVVLGLGAWAIVWLARRNARRSPPKPKRSAERTPATPPPPADFEPSPPAE